jgi:hypothetical protein
VAHMREMKSWKNLTEREEDDRIILKYFLTL